MKSDEINANRIETSFIIFRRRPITFSNTQENPTDNLTIAHLSLKKEENQHEKRILFRASKWKSIKDSTCIITRRLQYGHLDKKDLSYFCSATIR